MYHDEAYGSTTDKRDLRLAYQALIDRVKNLPDDPAYNDYRKALIDLFEMRAKVF
jgi:hypothetical protein